MRGSGGGGKVTDKYFGKSHNGKICLFQYAPDRGATLCNKKWRKWGFHSLTVTTRRRARSTHDIGHSPAPARQSSTSLGNLRKTYIGETEKNLKASNSGGTSANTETVNSAKKQNARLPSSKAPGALDALDRIGGTKNVAPDLIIASHTFCIPPGGPKGATVTIKNIGTSRSRSWYLRHPPYVANGYYYSKKGPPLDPGQSHEVKLNIFRQSPDGRRYELFVYEAEGDPIGLNRGSLTESDISNNIYRGRCIY